MIINPTVPLHRLVLSLSEGLDHVSPVVADHQLRVAYMGTAVAHAMGYRGEALRDIFHAAALHDVGLMRAANRVRALTAKTLEGIEWHGETGYLLLRDDEFFANAAPIVRHHHAVWGDGHTEEEVPLPSYIVAMVDTVDRAIRRDTPVLRQSNAITERIRTGSGTEFPPDCVDAFCELAEASAFWLDTTSKRIYSILARQVAWPTLTINEEALQGISHIFGRVVDSLSPWTATHSAGVAATAVALAWKLNFSPREQVLMRAAGNLHDLGKITVPSEILDKPDEPSEEEWAILKGHAYHTFRILDTIGGMPQVNEWAAFHHERLDGKGYPFGHKPGELTLGSRIMAVADTFTAIAEDRPYRKGMDHAEATRVLEELVAGGGLDGDIVAVLRQNLDDINDIRESEQSVYAEKQHVLAAHMGEAARAFCGEMLEDS